MNNFLERLLRSVDPPDPERAEHLWAEYRAGGTGADAAFATLVAWYGNPLYRRVWGFVRSDAAEDVFQDVLAKLHRERMNLDTFEHALRWLRTVAVNQALDARRRVARSSARDRRASRPESVTPAENDMQEALSVGLGQLPAEQQQAIALHYFEGLTKKDAATALGIDRDTFAARIGKALERLKSLVPVPALLVGGVAGLESRLSAHPPPLPAAKLARLVAGPRPGTGWLSSAKWKYVGVFVFVAAVAAASGYYLNRSPEMPAKSSPKAPRLGVELLEDRALPAASLASALGIGAEGNDTALDLAQDATGNTYMIGVISGLVDFDPSQVYPGDIDLVALPGVSDNFIAKYAADGSLAWVRTWGRSNDILGTGIGIDVDATGNIYVGGHFRDGAAFRDFTLTAPGGGIDLFLAKFDPTGNFVWAKTWGGPLNETYTDTALDPAGNAFVTGYTITSTGAPTSSVNAEVRKFAPNGDTLWSRNVGTAAQYVFPTSLATDAAGDVYVAGRFRGTADFFPSAAVANDTVAGTTADSGYVLKLTGGGNFAWVSPFLGITPKGSTTPGRSTCNDVAIDVSGNVIVGGYYSGRVDFKPGSGTTELPNSANGDTGYVLKLTPAGSLTWAKSFGVTVKKVGVDATGNVYAGGEFSATSDFDPGTGVYNLIYTGPHKDIFTVKLTSAGGFGWAAALNGNGYAQLTGMTVAADGTVSLIGTYQNSMDFDPDPNAAHTLTSAGGSDIFRVRLRQN